jgi:hypothetical protein
MSGQEVLDHVDTPPLESFGKHGVIRICKGVRDDVPGLVIAQVLYIKKLSQELNSCNNRVGVIHLNLVKLGKIIPICVVELESFNDILNSSAAEEELLFESQFLSFPFCIIRVEYTRYILSSLSLHDGLIILCIVELLKIEFV